MIKPQISPQNLQPRSKVRQDSRGRLIEVYKGQFSQCNLLEMSKGSIWGKHYHKKTTEFFYILTGAISVSLIALKDKKQSKRVRVFKTEDAFIIQPYTLHTIYVLRHSYCIVLYSHQFSEEKPDLYRL